MDKGFHVFAGVRSEVDGDALLAQAPERVTPLIIDVTDAATISAAAAAVAEVVGDRGLAGLVNNAGIGVPAPLEFQPMADFRRQLEVNLFGPVAMIQAFMPLIRSGGGRIVNVGSIGGMLVLPLNGAYSASKFGMRAISDALRLGAASVEHPRVPDRGRARRNRDLREDVRRVRRARGHSRGRGLRALREQIAAIRTAVEKAAADADPPLVIAEAIHRRPHLEEAEDAVSGRPRRKADRRSRQRFPTEPAIAHSHASSDFPKPEGHAAASVARKESA